MPSLPPDPALGPAGPSSAINQPATWPVPGANPEPMQSSADPESVLRWHMELFNEPPGMGGVR